MGKIQLWLNLEFVLIVEPMWSQDALVYGVMSLALV